MVCPKCMGNGYVYAFNYDERKKEPIDFIYCNNQGELDITEKIIKELQDTKDEKEKRKNI